MREALTILQRALADDPGTGPGWDAIVQLPLEIAELREQVEALRMQVVGPPVRGVAALAEVLGVSPRTLQRRLASLPHDKLPPHIGDGSTRRHVAFASVRDALLWWSTVQGTAYGERRVRRQRVPKLTPR